MLDTASTDDAYVNGHVTYVAPRVAGQVSRVLVDDNERVKKGDLLVQLDKEPYQVQVDIKKAALIAAEAELMSARAQVRGILAQAGSLRWKLQRSIEDVDDSVALLRARVATLCSKEASFERARADLVRARGLFSRNAIAREEYDKYVETERTAAAGVKQALEEVREARVSLGLAPHPEKGELTDVPTNINMTFSGVRQALSELNQSMAQVGFPLVSASQTPQQAWDEFARRDKEGNIDRILEGMVPEAPAVRQAEAKRLQAVRNLAEAELDLRYCDIASEIDGVVTSRSVNPGNHVSAGQSLMAVRSLTEIWIDANFKETQLADLRIGQRVRCDVDMYGGRHEFEGRITGFTMGTGQTLSLLPPQNATGNYVKIVQRLPVRIELADYDPDKAPLFAGLSVVPYVYYKESPTGPNAGAVLQPRRSLPPDPAVPDAAETRDLRPPSPVTSRRVTDEGSNRNGRRSIRHPEHREGGPV
jgi:membrane fusion protein (multidrug efflux system)